MKIALQISYCIVQDVCSRTCTLVVMLAVISNFGLYHIGLHYIMKL